VREIAEYSKAGDLDAATRCFVALERREPDIPFDGLVRLPLQVSSFPTGATVYLDDENVGVTPLQTSYLPSGNPVVRVVLEGFTPVVHTLRRKVGLLLQVVLVRQPVWTLRAKGVVESKSLFGGEGLVFLSDRSGSLTAVRRDSGDEIWSKSTGDLSGLLPTPVVWHDQVILTSLDGPVRSLALGSVRQLWEVDGVPCEGAPVLVNDLLVLGTTESELVALDLANRGVVACRVRLPGPVSCDVVAANDRIYLTTTNGWIVCANLESASLLWQVHAGSEITAAPAVGRGLVAVGCSEGRLLAVDWNTGAKVWEQFGLGHVAFTPIFAKDVLIVAVRDRLMSFRRSDGGRGAVYTGQARWSADPTGAGDVVLAGDRHGTVSVVDVKSMKLLHKLSGAAAVAGPPAVTADGWVVVGFEDRSVHCYRDVY